MPISTKRARALALAAGLVLLTCACGGGVSAPAPIPASPVITPVAWLNQIPAVPGGTRDVGHAISVAQQISVLGKDAIDQSAGAAPDGNSLVITAGAGVLEYGLFQFAAGHAAQSLEVDVAAGGEYWLGLADYDAMAWRFTGPYSGGQSISTVELAGDSVSGAGNVYALVLAYNGQVVSLNSITLNYDDGQAASANYLDSLQPLIATNCAGCHGKDSFTGIELHAYWSVYANRNLLVAQVVTGDHHLSDQGDKDQVQSFVDGGAPYGQAVTYTSDISGFTQTRCSPCHISSSFGGVNFSTYANATANGDAGLVMILGNQTHGGGTTITDGQLDIWQAWVNQGKLE